MLICRLAYDDPQKGDERAALFEAHRAHLRSGLIKIVQSGPLFACGPNGEKVGALVVFDVDDVADVHRFNAQDPYIAQGIYEHVRVLRWDRTIG